MSEKWVQNFFVWLGMLLLALVFMLICLMMFRFAQAIFSVDADVAAAIIGAILTAAGGWGATLYTQKQIKKRESDNAHRQKKVDIYFDFMILVRRIVSGEVRSEAKKNAGRSKLPITEAIKSMRKFQTEVMLWSSPSVLNAYQNFQAMFVGNKAAPQMLPAIDKLYRAMREDIGLSNRGLEYDSLVKMYLKNPSELDNSLAENNEKLNKKK